MNRTLVIASGYFDPLHVGHLEYLEKAASRGNPTLTVSPLIVIVNNDEQCRAKKGRPFMAAEDRARIVGGLWCVYAVYIAIDKDGSVCETIRMIHEEYQGRYSKFIFAKGGDRFASEIPERAVCEELGIELVDGLGEKIRSSSDLVRSVKE